MPPKSQQINELLNRGIEEIVPSRDALRKALEASKSFSQKSMVLQVGKRKFIQFK